MEVGSPRVSGRVCCGAGNGLNRTWEGLASRGGRENFKGFLKVSSDIAGNGDIIEEVQARYDETTRLVGQVLGEVRRGRACEGDKLS